jgi:hypothetical protein
MLLHTLSEAQELLCKNGSDQGGYKENVGGGHMKTPEEKYLHDPMFHTLVDKLEALIHEAQFTPSEMREAAIFACIRYELHRSFHPRVSHSLPTLAEEEG